MESILLNGICELVWCSYWKSCGDSLVTICVIPWARPWEI